MLALALQASQTPFRLRLWLWGVGLAGLCLLVRPVQFWAFLPAILAGLLWPLSGRWHAPFTVKIGAIGLLGMGLFALFWLNTSLYSPQWLADFIVMNRGFTHLYLDLPANAPGTTLYPDVQPNWASLLSAGPLGLYNATVAPFPFKPRNFAEWHFLLENLLYLFAFLFLHLQTRPYPTPERVQAVCLVLLFCCLGYLMLSGLSVSHYGSLARYRSLPVLLLCCTATYLVPAVQHWVLRLRNL
jgi:hypothetical protein